MEVKNNEQLRNHIQLINIWITALAQLLTTSRLKILLKVWQSVQSVEAQISERLAEAAKVIDEQHNLNQEQLMTQPQISTKQERVPECNHGGLTERIQSLEQQLEQLNPDLAELKEDLEDTLAQMKKIRSLAEANWDHVTLVLRPMERRMGEREEMESENRSTK
jgi:DNA-binding ferritin-like protein